jgi:hypothetical protein
MRLVRFGSSVPRSRIGVAQVMHPVKCRHLPNRIDAGAGQVDAFFRIPFGWNVVGVVHHLHEYFDYLLPGVVLKNHKSTLDEVRNPGKRGKKGAATTERTS